MSAFARLEKPDPIPLFAMTIASNRASLNRTYLDAFEAAVRRNEALDALYRGTLDPQGWSPLELTGGGRSHMPRNLQNDELLRTEAFSEDLRANQQASIVLLTIDDALQRLGRSLLGKPIGVQNGFGSAYANDVRLTSLLRAATNCIRHVSEWDDDEGLGPPYLLYTNGSHKGLKSINVLDKVLGFGRHDRVWSAPSFGVLAVIDGCFGTEPISYERCEASVLQAAREIIENVSPSLLSILDRKLANVKEAIEAAAV